MTTSPTRMPARSAGLPGVTTATIAPSPWKAAPAATICAWRQRPMRTSSMSTLLTPRKPFSTSPRESSCSTTLSIIDTGIARPMPANWPCPSALPLPVAIAVVMPTTKPRVSVSGPPELPGFTAASVWMKFS